MFNLGFSELFVILALALIFLGPRRLPIAAAAIGKALRDLRSSTQGLRDRWEEALDEDPPPQNKSKENLP